MLIPRPPWCTMARKHTGARCMSIHTQRFHMLGMLGSQVSSSPTMAPSGKVPTPTAQLFPDKEAMDSIFLPHSMSFCWAQSGKDMENKSSLSTHARAFPSEENRWGLLNVYFRLHGPQFLKIWYCHTYTHIYIFVYMFIYRLNKSTSLFVSCIIYSVAHTN